MVFSFFSNSAVSVGNGTDGNRFYLSAWFLDETREVKVCFEWGGIFVSQKQETIEQFSRAWNAWRDFILLRKARSRRHNPYGYKMSLDHVILETCDGNKDLTIYAGFNDEKIQEKNKGILTLLPLLKSGMSRSRKSGVLVGCS
jgi:hypothetical protein